MSKKLTIGKRIKLRRESLGISQYKLAQVLGLSRQYISMIELDTFKSIRSSLLVKLANILQTSIEYLAEGKELDRNSLIYIPIITWDEIDSYMHDDIKNNTPLIGLGSINSFAIINDTISMTSNSPMFMESFYKGDYLYFDPDLEPKADDYVLIKNTKNKKVYFRKLVEDRKQMYLVPLNNQFKAITLKPTHKICGVLFTRLTLFK